MPELIIHDVQPATVTILEGDTMSTPFDFGTFAYGIVLLPPEYVGTAVSFATAFSEDAQEGDWQLLVGDDGGPIGRTVTSVPCQLSFPDSVAGCAWMRLVSDVEQEADVELRLILKS